jgi:hypothetical protein
VSSAAIILCVASQRVFVVLVYFVIDSVRKLLDIPSYRNLKSNNTIKAVDLGRIYIIYFVINVVHDKPCLNLSFK